MKDCAVIDVDGSLDAIMVHVGVNELKTHNPETVGKDLIKYVYSLLKSHKKKKVIISKIAPMRDNALFAKGEVLNALLYAEFFDEGRVSFISHHQLQRQRAKVT